MKWEELQSGGGQSQSSDFIFIEAKHGRSVFFCLFVFVLILHFLVLFSFSFFKKLILRGGGFALGICFAQ